MPLPPPSVLPLSNLGLLKPESPLLEALADASVGAFEIDLRSGLVAWSAAVFRMFGIDPQLPATLADALSRLHPDDVAARQAAFERASTVGTQATYAADYRVVHPEGDVRWLQVRGRVSPTSDASDLAAMRLTGVVIDQTAQRRSETESAEMEQRRDRFLALLAHDLRNPLAPLHTAAELMRRAEMQPARVLAISDMLARQVAQMSHLIDDLVDVSRAHQGRIELNRQTVDLRVVVEQAVQSVTAFIERRRQRIEVRFDDAVPTLDVDPDRLVQILTHLLEHASRSSTEDSAIRIAVSRVRGEVVLAVADDGAGIESDRLSQVFDLYPSLDGDPNRRQTLGTGMALVKALASLHGGTVEAASDGLGKGATHTVRLLVSSGV